MGLPTLFGLVRADNYLRAQGVRDRLSLIAAGRLTTPGTILKALALGADAVDIGTMAIIALLSGQMTKALPGAPPYNLVMHAASHQWKRALNVEEGAHYLAQYLQSVRDEMCCVVQSLGKGAVSELDRTDLAALSPGLAAFAGVAYVGQAAEGVRHPQGDEVPIWQLPQPSRAHRPEDRIQ